MDWMRGFRQRRLALLRSLLNRGKSCDLISGREARMIMVRYGQRREHGSVVDFKLLIDVMEVHFDRAIGNPQPAPNFLVRQSLGYQTHDLALTVRQHRQHALRNPDVPSLAGYGLIGGR